MIDNLSLRTNFLFCNTQKSKKISSRKWVVMAHKTNPGRREESMRQMKFAFDLSVFLLYKTLMKYLINQNFVGFRTPNQNREVFHSHTRVSNFL